MKSRCVISVSYRHRIFPFIELMHKQDLTKIVFDHNISLLHTLITFISESCDILQCHSVLLIRYRGIKSHKARTVAVRSQWWEISKQFWNIGNVFILNEAIERIFYEMLSWWIEVLDLNCMPRNWIFRKLTTLLNSFLVSFVYQTHRVPSVKVKGLIVTCYVLLIIIVAQSNSEYILIFDSFFNWFISSWPSMTGSTQANKQLRVSFAFYEWQ